MIQPSPSGVVFFLFMMCVIWSAIKHYVYNVFVTSGGSPVLTAGLLQVSNLDS